MTSPKLDGNVDCLACLSLAGGEFDDDVCTVWLSVEPGSQDKRIYGGLRYLGLQTKINLSSVPFFTTQAFNIYCGCHQRYVPRVARLFWVEIARDWGSPWFHAHAMDDKR